MRFIVTLATLAVIVTPPVFAQDSTASDAPTTTITRTVLQATATSTVLRTSSTAVSTETYTRATVSAAAASSSASTIPQEFDGAASTEHSDLLVVALVGGALIAYGF